jgi:hypothetical protein
VKHKCGMNPAPKKLSRREVSAKSVCFTPNIESSWGSWSLLIQSEDRRSNGCGGKKAPGDKHCSSCSADDSRVARGNRLFEMAVVTSLVRQAKRRGTWG